MKGISIHENLILCLTFNPGLVFTCFKTTQLRTERATARFESLVQFYDTWWPSFLFTDRRLDTNNLLFSIFCLFSRSFVRALVKNFSMTFLFPVFITILFFQHNRTIYDVISNSTVVVTAPTRPRQQNLRRQ